MSKDLSERHCVPCRGGVPPLAQPEIETLARQLEGWRAIESHHLRKDYKLKNFAEALRFVNLIGEIAEREGHHPDIRFGWGYVEIEIYTHAINGLTASDFILAAKIDCLPKNSR